MRDHEGENSSFDLFLDTICNTFGGIVFLAILVALLIQTRAIVKTDQAVDESPVTAEQIHAMMMELDEVTLDYESLSAALAALPPVQPNAGNDEYIALLQDLDKSELELKELYRLRADNTKRVAKLLTSNSELRDENESVPHELANAQNDVQQGTKTLEDLVSQREATVNLPRERSTSSASVLMCLKNSEFFLAKVPGPVNSFNSDHVTTASSLGGGITIKPRLGQGWALSDPSHRNSIRDAKRNGYIVTIAVWPDSYGDFQQIKTALVEEQVPYQLWPQDSDEELTVFFGGGQSSVQ